MDFEKDSALMCNICTRGGKNLIARDLLKSEVTNSRFKQHGQKLIHADKSVILKTH